MSNLGLLRPVEPKCTENRSENVAALSNEGQCGRLVTQLTVDMSQSPVVRFGPRVGHIHTKWDESRTF